MKVPGFRISGIGGSGFWIEAVRLRVWGTPPGFRLEGGKPASMTEGLAVLLHDRLVGPL